VDAIRKVYRQVKMRVQRGLQRVSVESYLPELFEIGVGTGRRITAICSLRVEDLDLERTAEAPWGAIVWSEDFDKMGKRWRCPISAVVREALESALRKRQALGPWLFPSPGNPDRPVRCEEASTWLRAAEKLAGLEPQRGTLWHAYRRLWASARKDLPDVDVAQAGGWSSLDALKLAYQQPDDATMLRVVTHQAELREVR
jgi:integrase